MAGTISFEKAIEIAKNHLEKLQEGSKNIKLESALIDENDDIYEISFSYFVDNEDDLTVKPEPEEKQSDIYKLMALIRNRKTYKTFLVNKSDGKFKGFKAYQEE